MNTCSLHPNGLRCITAVCLLGEKNCLLSFGHNPQKIHWLTVFIEVDVGTNKKPFINRFNFRLKENKIIIANEGQDKNVMLITPPLCFTCDNARHIVQAIDTALAEIEKGASEAGLNQSSFGENRIDIPLNILSMPSTSGYSSEESDFDSDHPSKRARYEEVD